MMRLTRIALAFLLVFFLYSLVNNLSIYIYAIPGQYVLHSDGNCHFLPYESDTLWLQNDGTVISDNFGIGATYKVKSEFLSKQIKISYNNNMDGMALIANSSIFRGIKFKICMDGNTYYQKIN